MFCLSVWLKPFAQVFGARGFFDAQLLSGGICFHISPLCSIQLFISWQCPSTDCSGYSKSCIWAMTCGCQVQLFSDHSPDILLGPKPGHGFQPCKHGSKPTKWTRASFARDRSWPGLWARAAVSGMLSSTSQVCWKSEVWP